MHLSTNKVLLKDAENIDLGVFVDLWFTEDSSKIVEDMIELMRQDSLKARLDSILNGKMKDKEEENNPY